MVTRREKLLVVEDDPRICDLVSDILEDAGMEAICVQTDREAYDALEDEPQIRGLIVDVNLGAGTTGFDVARRARLARPKLPVLYITGEANEASFRAFAVPDSSYLFKPFTAEELLGKLKLSGRGGRGGGGSESDSPPPAV